MKWQIIGAENFKYESDKLESCIYNALAYCADILSKDASMESEGGPCIRNIVDVEEESTLNYFSVGWYYRDERFLTLQFREVCIIKKGVD